MAIEQRNGRIARIDQTREVFVFNPVTVGTIENATLRILDEKNNMFELAVGEVGAILGAIDEQRDFSRMVLNVLLQSTDAARDAAFAAFEAQLVAGRRRYEGANELGEALFGNEPEAAAPWPHAAVCRQPIDQRRRIAESIEPGGLEVPAPPPIQKALGRGRVFPFWLRLVAPHRRPASRHRKRLAWPLPHCGGLSRALELPDARPLFPQG